MSYDDVLAAQILREAGEKSDPKAWVAKRLQSVDNLVFRGVDGAPDDGLPRLKTKADREWELAEAEIYRNAL